jgi:catechol 2,3-dioxygenase-like lactoylglutathione lyase family enzyme
MRALFEVYIGSGGGRGNRVTLQRMDHVGIVVDDIPAAIAFFIDVVGELERYETATGSATSAARRGSSSSSRRRSASAVGGPGPTAEVPSA